MTYNIKPVTKELKQLVIYPVSVELDNSASINGLLVGEDFNQPFYLRMDNETYANWGNDDNYVLDWVLEQLGLELA